jgi:hypothetical protein
LETVLTSRFSSVGAPWRIDLDRRYIALILRLY